MPKSHTKIILLGNHLGKKTLTARGAELNYEIQHNNNIG